MTLSEQYADALNNLLYYLKLIKTDGGMIDGVPAESLLQFARSEITGLSQGFKTKDECLFCNDCCILPMAIVPAQGPDGGVARPLRYAVKYKEQPCWWLRKAKDDFRCSLHATGEKPYTCFSYQCTSREELMNIIQNAGKGDTGGK
jgi:hypothetical protein